MTIKNFCSQHAQRFTLVSAVFLVWLPAARAQESMVFGRWKVDSAKTVNAPREETRIFEDRGGGVFFSIRQGMDSQGREFFSEYAAKHDGKDYPRLVKGSQSINTIALTQVDPYTSTFVLKTDGKVTDNGKHWISKDGKTLTVETTGVNSTRTSVEVYKRQ